MRVLYKVLCMTCHAAQASCQITSTIQNLLSGAGGVPEGRHGIHGPSCGKHRRAPEPVADFLQGCQVAGVAPEVSRCSIQEKVASASSRFLKVRKGTVGSTRDS